MGLFNELAPAGSKMINSSDETVNLLCSICDAIKTVDAEINSIYEGNKFWVGTTIDVDTATTKYILGIVSAPITLMGARSIQGVSTAALSVQIELYEDVATATNSGNTTSYCMNRNLTSIGTFTINDAPATITATGTLLPPTNILKSATNFAFSLSADYKYVMKNNTKYALKITNYGATTATLTFMWTWSEL